MNAHNIWIAVPTYWTYPTDQQGDVTTVFDHPTPLNEDGTLARTLESFTSMDQDFSVIIVAAASHESLGSAIHNRLLELLNPFADRLTIYLVSPSNLPTINALLPEPILKLEGYGNIRNVQLAVPYAMGADVVVGIDDDEVIEDPHFLGKLAHSMDQTVHGEAVHGTAGIYVDRRGDFRLGGAEALGALDNIFRKKNYFMNEALKEVMAAETTAGLVKSNVAFGGNMSMTRTMIKTVCHDPYAPRGEDYDYVINAKLHGFNFYFQPDRQIIHLPPDSDGSQAGDNANKMICDIQRFTYMREKFDYLAVHFPEELFDVEYLLPYPGPYLEKTIDLREHGIRAMDELYPWYREKNSPEELVDSAIATAKKKAPEYFAYREQWKEATGTLEGSREAQDLIRTFTVSQKRITLPERRTPNLEAGRGVSPSQGIRQGN